MKLVLLCRSADLKLFRLQKILETLIKDLKTFENFGIIMSDVRCSVKGSIFTIVGDNLATHRIGDYVTSFSGNSRCCQYCLGTNSNFQTAFTLIVRLTKELQS